MNAGSPRALDLAVDGHGIRKNLIGGDAVLAEEFYWIVVRRKPLVGESFYPDDRTRFDSERRLQIGGQITPEDRFGRGPQAGNGFSRLHRP